MMSNEDDKKTAKYYRKAIREFMEDHNLNVLSWTKSAGLPESTLRNFLNADSESITIKTLSKLAKASGTTIGKILGESYDVDKNLLTQCIDLIIEESEKQKLKLSNKKIIRYAIDLYQIAQEDQKFGKDQISIGAARMLILKDKDE